MPEGIGYTDKELSDAIKFFKTQTTMSDKDINAIPTDQLVSTAKNLKETIDMRNSDRTGGSTMTKDVPLPPKRSKNKKMNKGGYGGMAMKKPEMMKGGMYKGKKHMYAAGGLVKELKM